jgi:cytochrome c556
VVAKHFPKGSGPQAGLKTRAKASVWTDQASFVKLQNDMIAAANGLNAAAIKGDVAALTAARTTLGGTCKSCHDKFRESD